MNETKVTSKFQATIPKEIREFLKLESRQEVEWEIFKGVVIVDTRKKMKNPTKFLTSQTKEKLEFDAVKLVRKSREEFT